MLYAPTHTVDVLTGTTIDDYGDPVDAATVAAAAVPVSILDQSSRTTRNDTDTPRTITTLKGRAPSGTPVGPGDRLRENATGQLWLVDDVSENTRSVIAPGVTMTLRRIP